VSFNPIVDDPTNGWWLDVLGYPIDPLEVVVNGTRHLHAVWDGIHYDGPTRHINITTLDTPLVAPGDIDHLLWYDGETQPDLSHGMHYNLFNNLWGTAFPQWSMRPDMFSRFQLQFSHVD